MLTDYIGNKVLIGVTFDGQVESFDLMEKIITLFQRHYDGDRLVRDEVVPGAEWVLAGEGVATRKFDGTCVKVEGGRLLKRYDFKASKGRREPPDGWLPAQPEPDPITSSWPGWIEVDMVNPKPEDQWLREAWSGGPHPTYIDGTYELCGPKVQGNPEHLEGHRLIAHGLWILPDAPRDFDRLRRYFENHDIEGIVWWHPDGRKCKIKAKDFGIKRQPVAV